MHSQIEHITSGVAAAAFFAVVLSSAASAQEFPYKECHIEMLPGVTVRTSHNWTIKAPNDAGTDWFATRAVAPQLSYQTDVKCTLSAMHTDIKSRLTPELSRLQRQILVLKVPSKNAFLRKELVLASICQASVRPRRLMPHKASRAVLSLSLEERKTYLTSAGSLNFSSKTFQSWLDRESLRRRKNENEMAFAWRTALILRKLYSYRFDGWQDRSAVSLCRQLASDCGGFSILFTSIMRANGIPARVLAGRIVPLNNNQAPPTKGAPQRSSNDTVNYKAPPLTEASLDPLAHVKAEFFASGIGWVPVDISAIVEKKSAHPFIYFGNDKGDFLTLHIDPDLILDPVWMPRRTLPFLQSLTVLTR